MDTQFKFGDGSQINFEKSAEVVKYNGGNLKNSLDKLTSITPYGKKLLAAQSTEEFNHLLRAEVPFIYDESERTIWNPVGSPYKTTNRAKFGKALHVDANNYLRTSESVTFGGQPFTIQCWINYIQPYTYKPLLNFGVFRVRTMTDNPAGLELVDSSGNYLGQFFFTVKGSGDTWQNKTFHLEIGYSGGNLYAFAAGSKKFTVSRTISRAARTITIGGGTGFWIDEFRFLDGVCAHTAQFTPPTAKYPVTNETVSLLHFD